jgi:hypothetical protein
MSGTLPSELEAIAELALPEWLDALGLPELLTLQLDEYGCETTSDLVRWTAGNSLAV